VWQGWGGAWSGELTDDTRLALECTKRALDSDPNCSLALAIAQCLDGQQEKARRTVAELMKIEPTLTVEQYLKLHPAADYETGKAWARALGEAGVPKGK
jgi:hypothetical protein